MATYDIGIGTEPMARSVDLLSASAGTINLSIGAMTKRLVKAEEKAANNISKNVTYGFYLLTRNQFRQKAIALENEINTTAMRILTYSKNLQSIRARMEKDYHNISRQYLKIFDEINQKLIQVVKDLDQGLFSVVLTGRNKLEERRIEYAVKASTYPNDILPVSQIMVLGRLKAKIIVLQRRLSEILSASYRLNHSMSRNLSIEQVKDEGEMVYFPFIISEVSSPDSETATLTNIHKPDFLDEVAMQDTGQIVSKIIKLKGEERCWKAGDGNREMVEAEFNKLLSGLDSRKVKLMLQLFKKSKWQEMGAGE